MHTNDRADHLGDDNHVAQVGLNNLGLLANANVTLGGVEALEESHGLALHTAVGKATAGTSINELDERGARELEQVLKIDAAVRELAEGALLATGALSVLSQVNRGL